jgi:hypothetical protein
MFTQDRSSATSGTLNRRDILFASTTLGVASALGSTALAQITLAQAQTALAGKIPIIIGHPEASEWCHAAPPTHGVN